MEISIPTTPGVNMSPRHVDATSWATFGYHVGPLNGKIPYTRHGVKDFTNNYATINEWWTRWPGANVGVRPPSWAVVLDVDVRSGGLTTWKDINAGHTLPDTLTVRTGSGGLHVWYRLPYAGDLRGQLRARDSGVDIKHHGGYLVAPGSIHPTTGNPYTVENWACPEQIPELPKHLRAGVYKPPKRRHTTPPVIHRHRLGNGYKFLSRMAQAPEGTRNDTLNRLAFYAAINGRHDLLEELATVAEHTGLTNAEVQSTINSATRAAHTKE